MKLRTIAHNALVGVFVVAMPLTTADAVSSAKAAATSEQQAQKLQNLKTKGAAEIDRRTANLASALEKLNISKKLTPADKTGLSKQLSDESAALAALKAKLAAETDLAAARLDVQGIVADYRVYVLMLPKARLLTAVDRLTDVQSKLTSLDAKLKVAIAARKSAGKDVSALTVSEQDLTAKLTATQSATTGMAAALLAITPDDYNANHTVLISKRDSLVTAQQNATYARDDAKSIIEGFKAL